MRKMNTAPTSAMPYNSITASPSQLLDLPLTKRQNSRRGFDGLNLQRQTHHFSHPHVRAQRNPLLPHRLPQLAMNPDHSRQMIAERLGYLADFSHQLL
jgi:hypothetical protein